MEKGKDLRGGGVRKRKDGGGQRVPMGVPKGGWMEGGASKGFSKEGGSRGGGTERSPPPVST